MKRGTHVAPGPRGPSAATASNISPHTLALDVAVDASPAIATAAVPPLSVWLFTRPGRPGEAGPGAPSLEAAGLDVITALAPAVADLADISALADLPTVTLRAALGAEAYAEPAAGAGTLATDAEALWAGAVAEGEAGVAAAAAGALFSCSLLSESPSSGLYCLRGPMPRYGACNGHDINRTWRPPVRAPARARTRASLPNAGCPQWRRMPR